MQKRRRLISPVVVCLAMVAAVLSAPGSAVGEEAQGLAILGSITAKRQAADGMLPDTITCTIKANNPHKSNEAGWVWSFHGQIKCEGANNGNVDALSISVELTRDGNVVDDPLPASNYGRNNIEQPSNAGCDPPGIFTEWQGEAWGYVDFPAGYDPPSANIHDRSDVFLQGFSCDYPPALAR